MFNKKIEKSALTTRIIWILLFIFLIITIISQIYIYFDNPLKTETAILYSTTKTIPFKGVSVRNEHPVQYSNTGVITYMHEDGSKLAKNSIIAQSYNNQNDISIQRQIDEITVKIRILRDAEALENTDNSQLESFNNQIGNKHSEIMGQINNVNYNHIYSLKNDYLSLLCKKMIVRGTISNYNEKIQELEQELAHLEKQKSAPAKNIMIDESGYFVSVTDGYENVLNFDTINELTKSDIEAILKNPRLDVSKNIIGKIIDEYKWQFAAILNTKETQALFQGARVKLRVGSNSNIIEVIIKKINHQPDGSSIFIFECDRLVSDYVKKRVLQYNLILESYNGIRIPSSAIRFNDEGDEGVYIKNGVEIEFKKINILLNENYYVLAEDTTQMTGFISLYDNIIVSGTELYDGKIVS